MLRRANRRESIFVDRQRCALCVQSEQAKQQTPDDSPPGTTVSFAATPEPLAIWCGFGATLTHWPAPH